MSRSTHPASVIQLYRKILTAHRVLPTEHRALGDAYVKEEFRRHQGERLPLATASSAAGSKRV